MRFKVRNAVDPFEAAYQANIEALKDTGSFVRREAKRLTRGTKKTTASPGRPWHSHKNKGGDAPLRRSIQFDVDYTRQSVAIGPAYAKGAATAPKALEYGGPNTFVARSIADKELARRRHVQQRNSRSTRATRSRKKKRNYTPEQLHRIRQYYGQVGSRRAVVTKRKVTVTIKPRPTMHIALYNKIPDLKYAWPRVYGASFRSAKRHFRSPVEFRRWLMMIRASSTRRSA